MTGMSKRTYLREVNPYLICPLCRGYLIDATTVVECLHSFCRSCILKHLRTEAQCPSCLHLLNKAKPNIKADKALQDIVYKLVPGLYHKEMRKRREYYKKHPEHADYATPEQRGDDVSGRLIFAPEDAISLSLEYLPPGADPLAIILSTNDVDTLQSNTNNGQSNNKNESSIDCNRRYLQCPALVTIAHLKKFLALKYSVDVTRYSIEICHRRAPLPEHWTLMDVAYIYAWKRNAPLRFFYRIMQEEQRLEAPVNDRPSTPGVGASLPAIENVNNKNENEVKVQPLKEESTKVSKGSKKNDVKNQLTVPTSTPNSSVKIDKKLESSVTKESAKAAKANQSTIDEEIKQIKSPIKILKNSEGRYEVLRSSNSQNSPEVRSNSSEKKSPSPEFSVVSIGDGCNSNGVKITLKQCPPGGVSSKPKIVSNVLMRNGQTDKILKSQEKSRQKEYADKHEKHKRKVSFSEKAANKEKDSESNNANKSITEQSDKKEFLHGFRLTAKQPWNEQTKDDKNDKNIDKSSSNSSPTTKITEDITLKSPEKEEKSEDKTERKNNHSGTIYSIKNKSPEKVSSFSMKSDTSYSTPKRFLNGLSKDLTVSDTDSKIDVYAFPNEPPTLPAGAVKRKCPPGLPIFDLARKRPHLQGQIRKKSSSSTSPKISKKQEGIFSPKRIQPKETAISCTVQSAVTSKPSTPTISDNTRNLLDGCGLNIPASLSITLTAPKSPSHSPSSTDTINLKDNLTLSGKVNPSITLNDRSVDPRVLKALKSGQIRMPVASSRPKVKPVTERGQPAKRKKDDSRDILDLSGPRKLDIHPLRIPQPISKYKSKSSRENPPILPASSQVVTLTGGQKYYRAPPGSLTPAVHRVADYPQTPPSRGPVYAPSCFSSSHNSSRNSNSSSSTTTTTSSSSSSSSSTNNISSVFPSLQSLYALSQAPNLQQFQMDNRLRLPQPESTTSSGLNKSHLAAQCAPLKPARSSFASLAVPILKAPTSRPVSFTPGSDLTKNKGATKSESSEKQVKTAEKLSRSSPSPSPASPHLKPEASADSNSQETASPRVSSTVSPSPPPSAPTPVNNNNSSNADEVSSATVSSKSGSEVTSTKSPESPDSSSVVNENSNSTTQVSTKEDKVSKVVMEKKEEILKKIDEVRTGEAKDKNMENIKVDVSQMTSEVFQKRLLAAFPSNEWANNPIAAKHLGNLLKSLTSMQDGQTGSDKIQAKDSKEISAKCVKDILPKANVEVTD